MPDEADGVPIMDYRVIAGDSLVDRHQDLFFSKQLKYMAELNSLPLNKLPN